MKLFTVLLLSAVIDLAAKGPNNTTWKRPPRCRKGLTWEIHWNLPVKVIGVIRLTQEYYFDLYKDAGFQTVRIPGTMG